MTASPVVYSAPVLPGNRYQELLIDDLRERGADPRAHEVLTLRMALRARRGVDVLHLHWIEYVIRRPAPKGLWRASMVLRGAHLLAVLRLARARGVRTVWTVHNIAPHEAKFPALEEALGRRVAGVVDDVHVHSEHAGEVVAARYGRSDLRVAPHAHYLGSYAEPAASRDELRAELGLPPEATVLLAFGYARRYKRVPELIRTLRAIPRPDLHLLVAGNAADDVRRELEEAAGGDPRVHLRLGFVSDDEVTSVHAVADASVLNYNDVFSSGALMLALTCGLPVIAPADSTATELAEPPVVTGYREGELAGVLAGVRPRGDEISGAATATAARYTWGAIAETVVHGRPH